jgi:hypothetical protein
MESLTRDRLIVARDTEEFVPLLAEAIEGSDEVLLAYVLGHIDSKSSGYVTAANGMIRRLLTDALNLNEVPKSAADYEDPATVLAAAQDA